MKIETIMTQTTPIVLVTTWYGLGFFELGVVAYAAFSNLFLIGVMMYLDRRDIYGQNVLCDSLYELYSLIEINQRNSMQEDDSSNSSKCFSIYMQKQLIIVALRFNRRIFFTRKIVFIMLIVNYAFTLWKMNHV